MPVGAELFFRIVGAIRSIAALLLLMVYAAYEAKAAKKKKPQKTAPAPGWGKALFLQKRIFAGSGPGHESSNFPV